METFSHTGLACRDEDLESVSAGNTVRYHAHFLKRISASRRQSTFSQISSLGFLEHLSTTNEQGLQAVVEEA